MWLLDFFSNIFEHFGDPKKRIFLGYILLSIGIAFLWLDTTKKALTKAGILESV